MPETKDEPLRQTVIDSVESWKKKEIKTISDIELDKKPVANEGFQMDEK